MINIDDSGRIIGDFLEINADIVKRETMSKLPVFIKSIMSYNSRKKLLRAAIKLKGSDLILSTENLTELFIYVYNNFPPKGSYKSIYATKIDEDMKIIEAIIVFDTCKAIITIEKNVPGFDISISDKKSEDYTEGSSIHCESLDHISRSEILGKINKQLKSDMTDYIIEVVSKYNKKRSKKE